MAMPVDADRDDAAGIDWTSPDAQLCRESRIARDVNGSPSRALSSTTRKEYSPGCRKPRPLKAMQRSRSRSFTGSKHAVPAACSADVSRLGFRLLIQW